MQMEPYSACRFGRRSLRAGGEAQTRRACPSCAKRGPLRRLPWSRGLRYNPIITARQGRVFPVVGGYQWIVTPLTSALKVFLGSYANLGHAVMSEHFDHSSSSSLIAIALDRGAGADLSSLRRPTVDCIWRGRCC